MYSDRTNGHKLKHSRCHLNITKHFLTVIKHRLTREVVKFPSFKVLKSWGLDWMAPSNTKHYDSVMDINFFLLYFLKFEEYSTISGPKLYILLSSLNLLDHFLWHHVNFEGLVPMQNLLKTPGS